MYIFVVRFYYVKSSHLWGSLFFSAFPTTIKLIYRYINFMPALHCFCKCVRSQKNVCLEKHTSKNKNHQSAVHLWNYYLSFLTALLVLTDTFQIYFYHRILFCHLYGSIFLHYVFHSSQQTCVKWNKFAFSFFIIGPGFKNLA